MRRLYDLSRRPGSIWTWRASKVAMQRPSRYLDMFQNALRESTTCVSRRINDSCGRPRHDSLWTCGGSRWDAPAGRRIRGELRQRGPALRRRSAVARRVARGQRPRQIAPWPSRSRGGGHRRATGAPRRPRSRTDRRRSPRQSRHRCRRHRPAGRGVRRSALHRPEGRQRDSAGAPCGADARYAGRADLLGRRRGSRLGGDRQRHRPRRAAAAAHDRAAAAGRRRRTAGRAARSRRTCHRGARRTGSRAGTHGVHALAARLAARRLPARRRRGRCVRAAGSKDCSAPTASWCSTPATRRSNRSCRRCSAASSPLQGTRQRSPPPPAPRWPRADIQPQVVPQEDSLSLFRTDRQREPARRSGGKATFVAGETTLSAEARES